MILRDMDLHNVINVLLIETPFAIIVRNVTLCQ